MFSKVVWTFAIALAVVAWAQEDYSKVEIKVVKVADSVYMLQGADAGNIGASVGEDGIVIVDDQYAPLADKIRAALKGVTDKPIRFVINTHYHGDHTGGNALFQKDAPIIAQDNVRKRMQDGGTGGNLGSLKFEPCISTGKTSGLSISPAATPTATASSSFPSRTWSTWATISCATVSRSSILLRVAVWRA
jgi:glyoxylase-like metal-dependent hydrolase (beta-lactamase superfamily II)